MSSSGDISEFISRLTQLPVQLQKWVLDEAQAASDESRASGSVRRCYQLTLRPLASSEDGVIRLHMTCWAEDKLAAAEHFAQVLSEITGHLFDDEAWD